MPRFPDSGRPDAIRAIYRQPAPPSWQGESPSRWPRPDSERWSRCPRPRATPRTRDPGQTFVRGEDAIRTSSGTRVSCPVVRTACPARESWPRSSASIPLKMERRRDPIEIARAQPAPVRVGGSGKAVEHPDPLRLRGTEQLAKRGVLSANEAEVGERDFREIADGRLGESPDGSWHWLEYSRLISNGRTRRRGHAARDQTSGPGTNCRIPVVVRRESDICGRRSVNRIRGGGAGYAMVGPNLAAAVSKTVAMSAPIASAHAHPVESGVVPRKIDRRAIRRNALAATGRSPGNTDRSAPPGRGGT